MQGVASLNDRCKDAVCHYELSWPPGERPTRSQWTDSAVQTLKALGYERHQYMIVAHDDKKHFHIHIMVNKVHPQTLRATTRYNNWLALDAAARFLEAKYGWARTPGMTRWDEGSKQAVPISRSQRVALRSAREQPTGAAAQFEHYKDQESFQSYVRREVAPSVRSLLSRRNITWDDLHRLLSKVHLRLEKGELGGYTVLAIDHNIRVKASDVFRNNFAGKINRQNIEAALGAWTPASTSGYEVDQHGVQYATQHNPRNSALREERKAQRHAERSALMADYNQYRNRRREMCKALTTDGREGRQYILDVLREQKREIRASALPWPDKKVLLSQAVAQSVLEVRSLKRSIQRRRKEAFPKDLRSWVADRADEGDARAAAQLRGWRYADQRNQRRLNARLESDALHIEPPPADNEKSDWADFVQQRRCGSTERPNSRQTDRYDTHLDDQPQDGRRVVHAERQGLRHRPRTSRDRTQPGRGGNCFRVGDGRPEIRIADRMYWKRRVEADGYRVCDQARHLRPIHGPGDASRLPPRTTPGESSPTSSCATAFHRNEAQN